VVANKTLNKTTTFSEIKMSRNMYKYVNKYIAGYGHLLVTILIATTCKYAGKENE